MVSLGTNCLYRTFCPMTHAVPELSFSRVSFVEGFMYVIDRFVTELPHADVANFCLPSDYESTIIQGLLFIRIDRDRCSSSLFGFVRCILPVVPFSGTLLNRSPPSLQ